jgi:two-component sensor histidine kinase
MRPCPTLQSYNQRTVQINYRLPDLEMNLNIAIQMGLIVNEVVSNCYKHAFKDIPDGKINIELHKELNNYVTLKIEDNGIGIPEGVQSGLGEILIKSMIDQIGGEYQFSVNEGTHYKFVFSLNN